MKNLINVMDDALDLFSEIINGGIKLADVKNDQETFKSHLCEIRKGSNNNNNKNSKEQKNTIQNIEMLCKSRNEVISFLMNMF